MSWAFKIKLYFLVFLAKIKVRRLSSEEREAFNRHRANIAMKKAKKIVGTSARSRSGQAQREARRAFIAAERRQFYASRPAVIEDPKEYLESLSPPKRDRKPKNRKINHRESAEG